MVLPGGFKLSVMESAAAQLTLIHKLRDREAARRLGTTPAAVKQARYRARVKGRTVLLGK